MEYKKFSTFIDSVQYGYTATETSLTEGDAKYLRITDIVPYFVEKERVPFCRIDNKNKSKYIVKENDLLIARTGTTTGYNLIVPKGFENYIFASYLVRFNYNQKELYPKYLKHVLKSQQYYGFVKNYIGGSAQPGMNPKTFGKFQVPYIEYSMQKRIADVLSAYDDLIENNNRRIALLEKAAQELYKEWFVRFRFPGYENAKFENGLPEGWKIRKLSQISDFVYGKMPNSNLVSDEGYPIFSGYRVSGYYPEYMYDDKQLILIARGVGGTGDIKLSPPKAYITNLAIVFLLKNNIYQQYLYHTYSLNNLRYLDTGAAQSQITIENLKRVKVVCPTVSVLDEFNHFVLNIENQIQKLLDKNKNLAKQRDLLLPRLMSGKLEV